MIYIPSFLKACEEKGYTLNQGKNTKQMTPSRTTIYDGNIKGEVSQLVVVDQQIECTDAVAILEPFVDIVTPETREYEWLVFKLADYSGRRQGCRCRGCDSVQVSRGVRVRCFHKCRGRRTQAASGTELQVGQERRAMLRYPPI